MRFLLTGGYGFVGSQVLNLLFTQYPDLELVVNVDRIDYNSRKENIKEDIRLDPRYLFVKGDIANFDLVSHLLHTYKISHVIHMAAQTHVDQSFYDSLKFTRDNILGTHMLLEACHRYGKLERFLHMSTDEVYGEAGHDAVDEGGHLEPTNPYAASKAGAELVLKSYKYSYNFPFVMVRGNNIYGHGQYPDKLIPRFILYLHLGRKLPIHGQGTAIRTFVHVDDMARGILHVLRNGKIGEIYNIGSENEFSVMEITRLLCDKMGKNIDEVIEYVPDRVYNDKRYYINYDKVTKLGWKEEVSFQRGLEMTIAWYVERADEFSSQV